MQCWSNINVPRGCNHGGCLCNECAFVIPKLKEIIELTVDNSELQHFTSWPDYRLTPNPRLWFKFMTAIITHCPNCLLSETCRRQIESQILLKYNSNKTQINPLWATLILPFSISFFSFPFFSYPVEWTVNHHAISPGYCVPGANAVVDIMHKNPA